jgi:hypothetical protein
LALAARRYYLWWSRFDTLLSIEDDIQFFTVYDFVCSLPLIRPGMNFLSRHVFKVCNLTLLATRRAPQPEKHSLNEQCSESKSAVFLESEAVLTSRIARGAALLASDFFICTCSVAAAFPGCIRNPTCCIKAGNLWCRCCLGMPLNNMYR